MAQTQAKDFKQKIHDVYIHDEFKTGGSDLRMISWVVNGKEMDAKLERRDYFMDSEGQRKNGKAKGYSAKDFEFIVANAPKIREGFAKAAREKSTEQMPPTIAQREAKAAGDWMS